MTPTACQALTGTRCRLAVAFVVRFDGRDRRLCGSHARIARRRPVPLVGPDHIEPELAHAGGAWTAGDDDLIWANLDVASEELARRLGRTVWAVKSRRARLRRRARGEGM